MEQERITTVRWLSGISTLVGVWLIIAPFVLGLTSTSAYWNEILTGAGLVLLGLYQLATPRETWPSWTSLIVAIWLVASPYVFNPVEAAAYNNAVTSGIIAGVLALLGAATASATVGSNVTRHQPM